jgi:integrase
LIRIQAKTVQGEHWEPKTKVNRAVPISSALRGYLERYRPMITPGKWFFPSPKGKHYDPDNFSRDLRKANEKASLKWTCLDYGPHWPVSTASDGLIGWEKYRLILHAVF